MFNSAYSWMTNRPLNWGSVKRRVLNVQINSFLVECMAETFLCIGPLAVGFLQLFIPLNFTNKACCLSQSQQDEICQNLAPCDRGWFCRGEELPWSLGPQIQWISWLGPLLISHSYNDCYRIVWFKWQIANRFRLQMKNEGRLHQMRKRELIYHLKEKILK